MYKETAFTFCLKELGMVAGERYHSPPSLIQSIITHLLLLTTLIQSDVFAKSQTEKTQSRSCVGRNQIFSHISGKTCPRNIERKWSACNKTDGAFIFLMLQATHGNDLGAINVMEV